MSLLQLLVAGFGLVVGSIVMVSGSVPAGLVIAILFAAAGLGPTLLTRCEVDAGHREARLMTKLYLHGDLLVSWHGAPGPSLQRRAGV